MMPSSLSQPISSEEQWKKEKIDSNKQPISRYYPRIAHKQDNEGRSPYGAAIFQSGFNGAYLRNVCTEAGMSAIRAEHDYVIHEDFLKATVFLTLSVSLQ
ncbi:hypothetical protein Tco_0499191 [Tanacetum coccineum]